MHYIRDWIASGGGVRRHPDIICQNGLPLEQADSGVTYYPGII